VWKGKRDEQIPLEIDLWIHEAKRKKERKKSEPIN
jgi:hypothetical protein